MAERNDLRLFAEEFTSIEVLGCEGQRLVLDGGTIDAHRLCVDRALTDDEMWDASNGRPVAGSHWERLVDGEWVPE